MPAFWKLKLRLLWTEQVLDSVSRKNVSKNKHLSCYSPSPWLPLSIACLRSALHLRFVKKAALYWYTSVLLFLQEVQDLLLSWSSHLSDCSRIFIRVPAGNKAIFFGSKEPPFRKKDPRIRTIPFPTRRPTFREVQRVHILLSSVECYGMSCYNVLQCLVLVLFFEGYSHLKMVFSICNIWV